MVKRLLSLVLLVLCVVPAFAQAPTDVPRDHWAYEAVNRLTSEGYMVGYPDGSFLGNRNLTRYEFAVVIARILQGFEAKLAAAQPGTATSQPSATTAVAPTEVGVSQTDVDQIRKLVEEFKPELVVIGTRLDKFEAELNDLKAKVDTMDAILTDPEGAFETAKADLSKLKKITLSGYVQSRYQTIDPTNYATSEEAYNDTFIVRRARIKVTAKPTLRSQVVLQLELAKNSVSVKDAYLGYTFHGIPTSGETFYVGQMSWPFGYEVPQSSSARETPERALVFRRLFPGERDQGAQIQGAYQSIVWDLGVFNGTGTEKNSATDKNDHKDIVFSARKGLGDLDLGVSYYGGQGVWQAFGGNFLTYVPKSRYGADMQWYAMNKLTLKAEYVKGRGVDAAAASWNQTDYVDGYYAQAAYNITNADTFVAKYSSMSQDPVNPQYGRVSSWDLGLVRWLDSNSRVKLFYEINNEEYNSIDNNGFVAEWIVKY